MVTEFWKWAGLGLVFLVAFTLSLFHASLSTFSKISLSRFLEDKDKDARQGLLDRYDETKIAVESLRVILLIAFLIYLLSLLPRKRLWPFGFFLLTLIIYFVFFDYLPRLLNSLDKKAVIKFFLPSFRFVQTLAAPLILLVRRLEDKQIEEEIHEASEEEIETFIDEATEEGIIEEEEGVLLRSVVEFGDTLVREIMTPRVEMVCIRKGATFGVLRDLILKQKYSRLPVYKDRIDNIEGIVIAKDLLQYSDDRYREMPIEPIIRSAYFIPESMKVAELLKEFQKRKLKMAVVVDEHGGVSGLVTMEDLVEEIVGEIQDEYDTEEEAEVTPSGPGEFIVRGDVEVESVEDLFGLDLAEDDYITASGLITHHLGRLPKRGETFEIKGLIFEILDADQKRIKKIKVRKTKRPSEEEGENR
jgi:CBS domain containing-hemolysin-like protein